MINDKNKEEQPAGDSGAGNISEANSIVERADIAAERLAKENERLEANLKRQEAIMARQALGGMSSGPAQPETPKEETAKEFKDKFMKGELKFPTK